MAEKVIQSGWCRRHINLTYMLGMFIVPSVIVVLYTLVQLVFIGSVASTAHIWWVACLVYGVVGALVVLSVKKRLSTVWRVVLLFTCPAMLIILALSLEDMSDEALFGGRIKG